MCDPWRHQWCLHSRCDCMMCTVSINREPLRWGFFVRERIPEPQIDQRFVSALYMKWLSEERSIEGSTALIARVPARPGNVVITWEWSSTKQERVGVSRALVVVLIKADPARIYFVFLFAMTFVFSPRLHGQDRFSCQLIANQYGDRNEPLEFDRHFGLLHASFTHGGWE